MKLKQTYQSFMRQRVDEKYFQGFSSVNILGEGFLNEFYIVIFLANDWLSPFIDRYYILIENIEKPILIELRRAPHKDNYVVFCKDDLRHNIPKALFNALIKNGLYEKAVNGLKKNNSYFGLSRLVACLYQNIIGVRVHHIHKNVGLNDVTRLLPVRENIHDILDALPVDEGVKKSIEIQIRQKKKIFKHRNTLASDDDLILDILKMRGAKIESKKIIKKMKGKIGRSKIYEHIKFFFYSHEYLKLVENKTEQELSAINGFPSKSWAKILDYEGIRITEATSSRWHSEQLVNIEKFVECFMILDTA